MIRLALGTLRRHRGGYLGTFVAALLTSALLAGSGLLLFSVLTAAPPANRFAQATLVVSGKREVSVTTTTRKKVDKVKTKTKAERLTGAGVLPADLAGRLAGLDGVTEVISDHAFQVALSSHDGRPVRGADGAPVVGHGWASATLTPYTLRSGAAPQQGQVALDADLAAVAGVRPGDNITVTTRTGVRVLRVSGIVAPPDLDSLPAQGALFLHDDEVTAASGLTGPTALAILAAPGTDPSALRDTVTAAAGDFDVLTGADRVRGDLPGALPDYIGAISIFGFVIGMTAFAAIFVLTGTVSLAVRQRLRELALLRTAGATPGQLRRLLSVESVAVAALAALPGLPLGVLVAELIASRFRELGAVPAQFTVAANPVVLLMAGLAGLIVALVAARFAARRAVRVAPSQALVETAVAPAGGWLWRALLAAILAAGAIGVLIFVPLGGVLGMGMSFVSCALLLSAVAAIGPVLVRGVLAVLSPLVGAFGVAGWLAAAVARTQARRFAAIAVPLALMFAINATMLLNSTLLDEVTGRQQADRIAAAGTRVSAPTGLPLAVAEQVIAVPGVTGAAVTFPTRVIVVTGGKPEDYPAQGLLTAGPESALDLALTSGSLSALAGPPASAASDGDTADQAARPVSEPAAPPSTPAADPKPAAADPQPTGGFAASGSLADAQRWRIGDAVQLWLADGYPVTLRLEAIYQRSRGFGDLVLPAGLIARHDPRGLAGAVLLRGDGVAERVRAGWPQLTVVDALAPAAAGDAQNQQGAWELMVVITLGFTAIAVVNTFAIATSARRREYGDLRLIGATTGQIWRTAGREGLLAVSAGLLLGCAVTAVVVGAFSVAQDGRFRLIVDAGVYLAMLGGVGSLGLLAGALPVRLMLRRRSLPAPAGDE